MSGALLLTVLVPLSDLTRTRHRPAESSRVLLDARGPVAREALYAVNARVRPRLLFWIGRDDIGEARITWRTNPGGRRNYELLIGSDPERAPRRINRWGVLAEELAPDGGETIGLMKDSGEQTLEEAEANIAQELHGSSLFKAVSTTFTGRSASSATVTFRAPSSATFHDLEAVLALMPRRTGQPIFIVLPRGAAQDLQQCVSLNDVAEALVAQGRARDLPLPGLA